MPPAPSRQPAAAGAFRLPAWSWSCVASCLCVRSSRVCVCAVRAQSASEGEAGRRWRDGGRRRLSLTFLSHSPPPSARARALALPIATPPPPAHGPWTFLVTLYIYNVCMSCRRGDRDFFVMRFPSYSQGRCVSICSACNTLHDRLWCRGMALRARACPLVKIAHLFSWRLGSNVERWSMAKCGFPARDFAHICSDGAQGCPSCAVSFLAGSEAVAWRCERARAPWSK